MDKFHQYECKFGDNLCGRIVHNAQSCIWIIKTCALTLHTQKQIYTGWIRKQNLSGGRPLKLLQFLLFVQKRKKSQTIQFQNHPFVKKSNRKFDWLLILRYYGLAILASLDEISINSIRIFCFQKIWNMKNRK